MSRGLVFALGAAAGALIGLAIGAVAGYAIGHIAGRTEDIWSADVDENYEEEVGKLLDEIVKLRIEAMAASDAGPDAAPDGGKLE